MLNGFNVNSLQALNTGLALTPNLQPLYPTASSVYSRTSTSYSGCDIRAVATDSRTGASKVFANLSTLSYSIHREKFPVRALGSTYAKDYTRGPRTIAGTLVFTVFDKYALWDIAAAKAKYDTGIGESAHSLLGDQMAPFNISCVFTNELGDISTLTLYNVELVDEGQVMSINDIYIESTHSFVARDIDVMYPFSQGPLQPQNIPTLNTNQVMSFNSGTNSVQSNTQPVPPLSQVTADEQAVQQSSLALNNSLSPTPVPPQEDN